MEEENENENLDSLIGGLKEAIKMSEQKQDNIDKKTKKMKQTKKIMEYEELKEEIDNAKKDKDEFDEMTINGLIRAKKEVLKQKDILQKKLKEDMMQASEEYKRAYAEAELIKQHAEKTLKNYEEKGNTETIEKAKKTAERVINNANKNLDDATKKTLAIQTEYKDKASKLDEYEISISEMADKLGALNEINAVKLEKEEKTVDEADKSETTKTEQNWVKDETEPLPEEEPPKEGNIYEEELGTNPKQATPTARYAEGLETAQEEVPVPVDTRIESITITNKTVKTIDNEGNIKTEKLGENVVYETKEEFLKAYREESIAEYYDAETLWKVYTDGNADLEILAAVEDKDFRQVFAYLNALGYENKKGYEPDLKQHIPLIKYDLTDKKETNFRERLENYRKAMKTKELLEKAGLDEHVEVDTRFFDRIAFGAIDLWERVTNSKQQKALPKPESEHTTTEPNAQESEPEIREEQQEVEQDVQKTEDEYTLDSILKEFGAPSLRDTVEVPGAREATEKVAEEFSKKEEKSVTREELDASLAHLDTPYNPEGTQQGEDR